MLKARGLPIDPATKKPVCPYVKVAYRDDGARSDKTKTYKIGRTNLAWRDANPTFGVTDVSRLKKKVKKQLTPDLLKFEVSSVWRDWGGGSCWPCVALRDGSTSVCVGVHQVTAPRDDQVGRLLQTKLLPWKRYRAPEEVPDEWAEAKVDPFAFQFHVPPPRMVYRDHVEVGKTCWSARWLPTVTRHRLGDCVCCHRNSPSTVAQQTSASALSTSRVARRAGGSWARCGCEGSLALRACVASPVAAA